jgi:hypothetical protein
MKKIISIAFFFNLFIGLMNGYAQKEIFTRVYNEKGKKINKGHLLRVTDSSVILVRNQVESEVTIDKIGTIRLKRSFGSNVLKAGMISGVAFAVLGVATADPTEFLGYTAGEGAAGGFIYGAILGGAIGTAIDATIHRPKYVINQDQAKWKEVKEILHAYSTSGLKVPK